MGVREVALLWLFRVLGLAVLSGAVLVAASSVALAAAMVAYMAGLAGWPLVDSALSSYLAGVALLYLPLMLATMLLDTARFSSLLSRVLLTLTLSAVAMYAVWAYTGNTVIALVAMATVLNVGITRPAMRIAGKASQALDRLWDPDLDRKALAGW